MEKAPIAEVMSMTDVYDHVRQTTIQAKIDEAVARHTARILAGDPTAYRFIITFGVKEEWSSLPALPMEYWEPIRECCCLHTTYSSYAAKEHKLCTMGCNGPRVVFFSN